MSSRRNRLRRAIELAAILVLSDEGFKRSAKRVHSSCLWPARIHGVGETSPLACGCCSHEQNSGFRGDDVALLTIDAQPTRPVVPVRERSRFGNSGVLTNLRPTARIVRKRTPDIVPVLPLVAVAHILDSTP